MRKRTIAIVASAALLGGAALGGVAAYAENTPVTSGAADDAPVTVTAKQTVPQAKLSTNARGETFGRGDQGWLPSQQPDLIQAIGVDGTQGYVKQTDLLADMPKTLEERVRLAQHPSQESRTIPLYESDGVTVVGEFQITPAMPEDQAKSAHQR